VHTGELEYLRRVGTIFGFDAHAFERIRAQHMGPDAADPYQVLLHLGMSTFGGKAEVDFGRLDVCF
jgi:hypothetical protein